MNSINDLQSRFGSENVSFYAGPGGMTAVKLANASGEATLTLYGAHVMSYTPAGALPVLWMSEKSMFTAGDPIRGGIPVCWPWFGKHKTSPELPTHGYARLCEWEVASVSSCPEGDGVELHLAPEKVPAKWQPLPVELTFQAAVEKDGVLRLVLSMLNCGEQPVAISSAMHTYFAVDAIENVAIDGLEDVRFVDTLVNREGCESGPIRINGETDRVYLDCENDITLRDGSHYTEILREGSRSAVVWNPWIDKSRRLPDFGDEEYHRMVCVETTNALEDTRILEPDGFHVLATAIIRH